MERRPIGLAPGAPVGAMGQDERKYTTRNPVVLRLIGRWLGKVAELTRAVPVSRVLDVGVGEGIAMERVRPDGAFVAGVEYREDKLASATKRLPRFAGVVGDAGMLPVADSSADLVTCIEVLEHLVRPDAAVSELARVASDRCVVSVPWEPWFRLGNLARGKNLARAGNDPEHVQAFSPRRLRRLLLAGFDVVEVHRVFPWLVAVASSPRSGGDPRTLRRTPPT
jgi:SAM-dependent methyltransferase